jgi:hypothetical protein
MTDDQQKTQFTSNITRMEQAIQDLETIIKNSEHNKKKEEIVKLIETFKSSADINSFDQNLPLLATKITNIEKEMNNDVRNIQEGLLNIDISLFQQYGKYINSSKKPSKRKQIFNKINPKNLIS